MVSSKDNGRQAFFLHLTFSLTVGKWKVSWHIRHHGYFHHYQSCNFVLGKKIQNLKESARLWKWFALAKKRTNRNHKKYYILTLVYLFVMFEQEKNMVFNLSNENSIRSSCPTLWWNVISNWVKGQRRCRVGVFQQIDKYVQ